MTLLHQANWYAPNQIRLSNYILAWCECGWSKPSGFIFLQDTFIAGFWNLFHGFFFGNEKLNLSRLHM